MFVRQAIATILMIGFCNISMADNSSGMTANESATFENLKRAFAFYLSQNSYDQYVPKLLESGATDEEAAEMLREFGLVATECIFDAAKSSAEKRSIDFGYEYVVATMETTDLRPLFQDEAEYRELVGPCFDAAREKSGITLLK